MQLRSFGHRAPLLWLVIPFALGIIAARLSPVALPGSALLVTAVVALLVACRWHHAEARWGIALVLGLFAAGAVHYDLRRDRLAPYETLPPREATLTLQLGRAFGGGTEADRFSGFARIVAAPRHLEDLVGQRVQVSFRVFEPGADVPSRGALVRVTGVLEPLPRRPAGDDDFMRYLVDLGLNFRLGRGSLDEVIAPPGPVDHFLNKLLAWSRGQLGTGLDHRPDLSAALRAMLLGERHELSEVQKSWFLRSGTMHLFAISGLHIGALALGVHAALKLLRLPRLVAFLIGTAGLWIYVAMVGAPPSAVRAFLMVVCVQAASAWRRPGNGLAGLVASALLVLLLDPMQLFGAGFQMSYAIVAALIMLGLPLGETVTTRWPLWRDIPAASRHVGHRVSDWLWQRGWQSVGLAVSAALVSSVSSPAIFGWFTPGSLAINLVFIPAAVLVVFAGQLALSCGAIGLTAGALLFTHAAGLVIALMQGVLAVVGGWPGVAWEVAPRWEWWYPVTLGGLLALITAGYAGGWRLDRGGYWPPFIWVAAMLVTGLTFV